MILTGITLLIAYLPALLKEQGGSFAVAANTTCIITGDILPFDLSLFDFFRRL